MAVDGQVAINVVDLLRQIDAEAQLTFVQQLGLQGSLGNARLACQALRALVDSTVKAVSIIFTGDRPLWSEHGPCNLARWPACESVALQIRLTHTTFPTDYIPEHLLQPFEHLPLPNRQRIRSLKVSPPRNEHLWLRENRQMTADAAVSALSVRLPELRALDLGCLWEELTLAGADLPHVEQLVLPSAAALGAGNLTCLRNLSRLEISNLEWQPSPGLAVNGLFELRQLTHLRVHVGPEVKARGIAPTQDVYNWKGGWKRIVILKQLLDCLPPSLQHLQLDSCIWEKFGPGFHKVVRATLSARINRCRFTEVTIAKSELTSLYHIADLAVTLLSSHVMEPEDYQLGLLSFESLELWSYENVPLLDPVKLQPLRALLARCRRVDVGLLDVRCDSRIALLAVDLLGTPQWLRVGPVELRLRGGHQSAGGAAVGQQSPTAGLPLSVEVMAGLIQWRTAAGDLEALVAAVRSVAASRHLDGEGLHVAPVLKKSEYVNDLTQVLQELWDGRVHVLAGGGGAGRGGKPSEEWQLLEQLLHLAGEVGTDDGGEHALTI